MGHYVPSTKAQQQQMLDVIGVSTLDALYADVPEALIRKQELDIPKGQSELEVLRTMSAMADKNTVFNTIFRGAGAYRHYIPSVVGSVVGKETFLTAYTPYQAEISQGILQSIFEYQTMICQLTGMDSANASVYDGATAAAEAVSMCVERKKSKVLVSSCAHPDVIETVRTYCWGAERSFEVIPTKEGATDFDALEQMLDDTTACVYLQYPNYFGTIEDVKKASELAHAAGAKMILGVNPVAMAVLKTPAECGADIAVGEGQPLGMPLSFGGPYLGFMAATSQMVRKLPGRIVGQTTDLDGNRAFVLTLQAREQHIRREKASSNICSNQALCAMTAAVYLATMGPQGMREAANQCHAKAHYLADAICQIGGFSRVHDGPFFHEFVTTIPEDSVALLDYLASHGVLGGLPVADGLLWCVTELNTKQEMDLLVKLLKERYLA